MVVIAARPVLACFVVLACLAALARSMITAAAAGEVEQFLQQALASPTPWLAEEVERCMKVLDHKFESVNASPWHELCASTRATFQAHSEGIEQVRKAEYFYRRSAELLPNEPFVGQLQQLAFRCFWHLDLPMKEPLPGTPAAASHDKSKRTQAFWRELEAQHGMQCEGGSERTDEA